MREEMIPRVSTSGRIGGTSLESIAGREFAVASGRCVAAGFQGQLSGGELAGATECSVVEADLQFRREPETNGIVRRMIASQSQAPDSRK